MDYSKTCPICECSKELNKFKWGDYKVIHCNNCKLDYCSKMYEKEIGGDSSPVHLEGIEMMASTLHKTKDLAQHFINKRVDIYESLLNRKCKNVLEVGCGAGVFYEPFKNKSIHWDGIDINQYWISFGEKNKIPISNQPLEKIEKKYDIILAYQVLEHVENPIAFMNTIVSKLNPGGIIHLELPNQNSLNARIRRLSYLVSKDYGFIQPPMHLRAYQKYTLEYLFKELRIDSKKVFVCANTDNSWGQVRDYNFFQKNLYNLSGKLGLGSLLIGLGQKPF